MVTNYIYLRYFAAVTAVTAITAVATGKAASITNAYLCPLLLVQAHDYVQEQLWFNWFDQCMSTAHMQEVTMVTYVTC